MRITAEEKSATRQRILQAAVDLFRTRGFDATTTRDIAGAAEIATGTLFNYFATKDEIVGSLAEAALVRARATFARRNGVSGLEENLFTLIASELRQLKPLRRFIAPLLETSLSPLSTARRPEAAESMRIEHLEIVVELARVDGLDEPSPLALQVYWTLYTGVLAFWASDKSPKQEDTLALLDQSLAMFVAWLKGGATKLQ
jgi:AcrR family transcriptional regulator